jgi:hypothetical protein
MAIREGLVANLANPSPPSFMLAFLPQFVDPSRGSVIAQLLVLGATQKVTGFAVLGATALASGAVGGWLARRPSTTNLPFLHKPYQLPALNQAIGMALSTPAFGTHRLATSDHYGSAPHARTSN